MENTQNETPARDALMTFILNMTPEQVDKLIRKRKLLELLPTMTDKQLLFTESFLERLFRKDGATA